MSFFEMQGDDIVIVVNGCADCIFRITATPRDYCILCRKVFDIDEAKLYRGVRSLICPLPVTKIIKVIAHAYSGCLLDI